MRTNRRLSLIGCALGVAALLAGCAADSEEPATTDNSVEEQTREEARAAEEDRAADEDGAGDGGGVGDEAVTAACLTGSWQLRNETFEAALVELVQNDPSIPADMRAGMDITLSGGSFIRFDGGDLYTAWQDEFTMAFEADGQQVQHVQSSDDAATYGVEGEYVWVRDFTQLHLEAEMRIAGIGSVALEGGSDAMASVNVFGYSAAVPGIDRELVDGVARYECAADALTLYADADAGMAASFTRIADES